MKVRNGTCDYRKLCGKHKINHISSLAHKGVNLLNASNDHTRRKNVWPLDLNVLYSLG